MHLVLAECGCGKTWLAWVQQGDGSHLLPGGEKGVNWGLPGLRGWVYKVGCCFGAISLDCCRVMSSAISRALNSNNLESEDAGISFRLLSINSVFMLRECPGRDILKIRGIQFRKTNRTW